MSTLAVERWLAGIWIAAWKRRWPAGPLMMATHLRNPAEGLLHHSGHGSQYASHAYQALLQWAARGTAGTMHRLGRFFSSLKREWLTEDVYPTREDAVADVGTYIAYYHSRCLHTTLGNQAGTHRI